MNPAANSEVIGVPARRVIGIPITNSNSENLGAIVGASDSRDLRDRQLLDFARDVHRDIKNRLKIRLGAAYELSEEQRRERIRYSEVKDEIKNNRRLERIARRQHFADLEVQTGNRSPYAATRNFFNMITPNPRR
jgi:hypothetical protein